MPFKLIVFDLDGTLADTEADLADSINELRGRLGYRKLSRHGVGSHVGQGVKHLLRQTVPNIPDQLRVRHPDVYREFQRIYDRRCALRTRLYPGARAVITRLGAGATLAVATNKPGKMSRKILRRLGVLRRFKAVIGGDEIPRRKPHPAMLLQLMWQFQVKPVHTIMVGDSRFDMETARRAKVRTVACTWGFGSRAELRKWKPDATISRIAALPAALARLD